MSLLIDVIVIAAFAGCLIKGIKKGFIKSIIGIVIVIAAIFGSIHFSPALASSMNDKFVYDSVISVAKDSIPKVDTDTLVNDMPSAFKKVLDRFGTSPEDIQAMFENSDPNETEEAKRERIAEKMGAPLAKAISKALAFLIVFALIYVILLVASVIICAIVPADERAAWRYQWLQCHLEGCRGRKACIRRCSPHSRQQLHRG